MRLLISGIYQDFKPTVTEEEFWMDNTGKYYILICYLIFDNIPRAEDGKDVEDFVTQFDAIKKGADVTVDDENDDNNEEVVTDAMRKEASFMGVLILSFP